LVSFLECHMLPNSLAHKSQELPFVKTRKPKLTRSAPTRHRHPPAPAKETPRNHPLTHLRPRTRAFANNVGWLKNWT
jgi:hypothetical protein